MDIYVQSQLLHRVFIKRYYLGIDINMILFKDSIVMKVSGPVLYYDVFRSRDNHWIWDFSMWCLPEVTFKVRATV